MSENKERIVLDVAYQPQVRTNTDTKRIMLNVIIALLPALAVIVGVLLLLRGRLDEPAESSKKEENSVC